MDNLPTYCGLVDARIRASDKHLPVRSKFLLAKEKVFFAEFTFTYTACHD